MDGMTMFVQCKAGLRCWPLFFGIWAHKVSGLGFHGVTASHYEVASHLMEELIPNMCAWVPGALLKGFSCRFPIVKVLRS